MGLRLCGDWGIGRVDISRGEGVGFGEVVKRPAVDGKGYLDGGLFGVADFKGGAAGGHSGSSGREFLPRNEGLGGNETFIR